MNTKIDENAELEAVAAFEEWFYLFESNAEHHCFSQKYGVAFEGFKEGRSYASRRAQAEAGGGVPDAWVICDGKNMPATQYRTFDGMGHGWTIDIKEAMQFARRRDADLWAREDEDAWRIIPVAAAIKESFESIRVANNEVMTTNSDRSQHLGYAVSSPLTQSTASVPDAEVQSDCLSWEEADSDLEKLVYFVKVCMSPTGNPERRYRMHDEALAIGLRLLKASQPQPDEPVRGVPEGWRESITKGCRDLGSCMFGHGDASRALRECETIIEDLLAAAPAPAASEPNRVKVLGPATVMHVLRNSDDPHARNLLQRLSGRDMAVIASALNVGLTGDAP